MPLNKLENFIKNVEGRILYVNPNDLDATDGIENQGNSLTKPFKTIQRALIESARFSYLEGDDNDLVERTTILLFPGEHIVDNRPGFGIRSDGGIAKAIHPNGSSVSGALNTLTLTLNSNFDLTQEDNILYKFNSTKGGVVVPRGTSLVGLDLRKTKIRPKYVPNPTDPAVDNTAIFRITGACYFWQFTIFDGDEKSFVYTDPKEFNSNQAIPTFSHHKVTCFEYADGINTLDQFSGLTDLDVYYSKLSNAFNVASTRDIINKYPLAPKDFSKQRPEFEIVGAFATDPLKVTNIISGDGATPGQVVTVTTKLPHNLTGGTPIKMRGVNEEEYNISTKVQSVLDDNRFTYLLPLVPPNLKAGPAGGLSAANAQVLVETDTVTGASPYVFNCSMRSVFGIQGMHCDGSKATGFRSMVVAQFTAVSLQKDDRAFVKYDETNRKYDGLTINRKVGAELASESSSTNPATVFHLDPGAVYRYDWRTSHIKVSNDAVVQIVSVFAIGFHSHFNMLAGADASITNSNSNFGQFALAAEGFKKEAFEKDNKGFVTSIITPRAVVTSDQKIEWLQIDPTKTASNTEDPDNRLYLLGQTKLSIKPTDIAQGFRIGARVGEKVYIDNTTATPYEASIVMTKKNHNDPSLNTAINATTSSSEKMVEAKHTDASNSSDPSVFNVVDNNHDFSNGESVRIISESGDLPENIDPHRIYYVITNKVGDQGDSSLGVGQLRIASSFTNATLATPVFIKSISDTNTTYKIISRVSDKKPGDIGHPIQWDGSQWYVSVSSTGNTIKSNIASIDNENISYVLRRDDDRSLDEKIYKLRYVVPKELDNGRDPIDGFVLQDSSSTNVRFDSDFTENSITKSDYDFDRNTRFISFITKNDTNSRVTVRSDRSHNLNVGEQIVLKNITSNTNTTAVDDKGYNGTFEVTDVIDEKTFKYSYTDVFGITHNVGVYSNDTHTRSTLLPRFNRNDHKGNYFIYRTEVITPYRKDIQDGVYHLFVLNGANEINETSNEFTRLKYNQSITDLYPQYDRDNIVDNPQAATTFAKRHPIGEVVTNDLKKSVTRESTNKFLETFDVTNTITSITDNTTTAILNFNKEHNIGAIKYLPAVNGSGNSGHTDGTYHNIKLFNTNAAPASAIWDGATATVVVSGGAISSATLSEGGAGYTNGETLYFDSSPTNAGGIGGSPGANVTIATANISIATSNYVQVTGISTGTDGYYRIDAVNNKSAVQIKKTASDVILVGQQVVDLGPVVEVSSVGTPATVEGVTRVEFTCTGRHGLVKGNSLTITDTSNAKVGDFIVDSTDGVDKFTAITTGVTVTSAKYVLKHGLSSNEAISSKAGENLDVRGLSVFDHETLLVAEASGLGSGSAAIKVTLPDGSTTADSIKGRFPLGSYIQIEDEIMRVSNSALSGSNDTISVIRGALGTLATDHANGSLIKKIKPLPIELRRPSILRASGHTFEYLGYGPGNYSTALPQLQLRTLSEREEFLSQSQETSCGNVVYTGMNDKGDFYIGNTKISSASGEQITFDIPIPTVTGEDPNRSSVVFDEVIVKERLLVEGGSSGQILSQFDGPVTFNGTVRLNEKLTLESHLDAKTIKVRDETNSTSCTIGALTVKGGVGIAKSVHICGATTIHKDTDTSSEGSGALVVTGGVGIGKGLWVKSNLRVEGNATLDGNTQIGDGSGNDLLTVTAKIDSNLIPATTGKNLGGSTTAENWNGVFCQTVQSVGVTISGATASTNKTSGALTVAGGVGIGGDLNVGGDITAYASSDKRLKDNITPISNALDKVLSISGNTFNWNSASSKEGKGDTGVIAQEIEALDLPGVTTIRDDGTHAVAYEKLVPLLIEAIKELSTKVDALS
tara:strand:- start:4216 stop:9783 length:5568 start_codon:yes stop_codon:yes gene_type:complete